MSLRCFLQAIYNMVGTTISDNDEEDSPQSRTKEIFIKMDENKDGVLSREEFIKGCMSDSFLYQMLTADQSGIDQWTDPLPPRPPLILDNVSHS